ncbi:MAG: hypothetical protein KKD17_06685 [Nanoarchaeota archaeon]|nr:hypothetical protein [Nanoarchaeota archaeon]
MAEPAMQETRQGTSQGTMQGNIDAEKRKKAEFLGHRADFTHHLADVLEEDFAKSPEGKEAAYLKRTVLERSIDTSEHFVEYVVAGTPGDRGVHHLISFLENPSQGMAKDEALVKRMRKLADEMEKAKLPGPDELKHYTQLKRLILQLGDTADIHEFIVNFNNLLRSAAAYPETLVAKKVKSRSSKEIPAIIRMENFEFTAVLLKLMLSRLFMPDQRDMALRVIGRQDFRDLAGKMAAKLKIGEGDVLSYIKKCFPLDQETDDRTNIIAFTNDVAREQKKDIFIMLITELGNEPFADAIRKMCGSKGKEKADPEVVKKIANQIIGMNTNDVKRKVEHAAKAELVEAVEKTLKGMEDSVEDERKKFVKLISDRVDELQEAHSKNLKRIENQSKALEAAGERLAVPMELAMEDYAEIKKIEGSMGEFMQRAIDVTGLIYARLTLQSLEEHEIDPGTTIAELNRLISAGMSGFFLEEVVRMRDAVSMPPEEYHQAMARADKLIEKLKAQVPQIISSMRRLSEKGVRVSTEFEGLRGESEYELESGYKEALDALNELKRMKLDKERYREEISPDEYDMFEEAA